MPHHLVAAAAAHTWAREWTGAATGLSSLAFFWLGMLNVTLLLVFFSIVSKRRDMRHAAQRGTTTSDPGRRATDHPLRRATDEQPAAEGPDRATLEASPGTLEPAVARMRLSDAERDEAADRLCRAIAEGRLDIDEGAERIDKVLAATCRGTLVPVLADLPLDTPTRAPGLPGGVLALRVVAVALILGAAALQGLAGIWGLWPVAIAALAPLAFSPRQHRASPRQAAGRGRRRRGG